MPIFHSKLSTSFERKQIVMNIMCKKSILGITLEKYTMYEGNFINTYKIFLKDSKNGRSLLKFLLNHYIIHILRKIVTHESLYGTT